MIEKIMMEDRWYWYVLLGLLLTAETIHMIARFV